MAERVRRTALRCHGTGDSSKQPNTGVDFCRCSKFSVSSTEALPVRSVMNDSLMSMRSKPTDIMATGLTTRERLIRPLRIATKKLMSNPSFFSFGNRIPPCQGQQMRDRRFHCMSIAHKIVTVFPRLSSFCAFLDFHQAKKTASKHATSNAQNLLHEAPETTSIRFVLKLMCSASYAPGSLVLHADTRLVDLPEGVE